MRFPSLILFPVMATAVAMLWCGTVVPAMGEVFHLSSGGSIEGTLLNPDESPRMTYEVETSSGKLVLGRNTVRDVVAFSEQLKQYETFLPRMPDTIEGQFQMARWCDKNNLPEKRDYHYNEILKKEPDNEAARRALGYDRFQGKWIIRDEWNRQQGYVREGRSWRYPQDITMSERAATIEEKQVEWRKQIRILYRSLRRGGDKAQQAAAEIQKINDPYAALPLIEILNDERVPAIKELIIEALTNIDTSESTMALVKVAADDEDPSIRDRATIGLENRDNRLAVNYLISKLDSKSNERINRAALVLARLKNPSSVRPLIEALVTTHKYKIQQGGQPGRTTAGFGDTGGGGMSFGQKGPIEVERNIENHAVLRALLEIIEEDVNFQFDEASWKLWYANKKIPLTVDLRRDG